MLATVFSTIFLLTYMLWKKIIKLNLFQKLYAIIQPFCSWRIIVCYLPFWFLATGWTYVALAIGNTWWRTASGVWLVWMWMPWCPEKLITIPLTIWLHKKLFPSRSTKVLDNVLKNEKENTNLLSIKSKC